MVGSIWFTRHLQKMDLKNKVRKKCKFYVKRPKSWLDVRRLCFPRKAFPFKIICHESIFSSFFIETRLTSASHTWCWQKTFHPEEASSLSINNKQKLFDTAQSLSARSSLRIKFYESSAFRRNLWIFKRIAKQIYECLLLNSRRCRPKCRTWFICFFRRKNKREGKNFHCDEPAFTQKTAKKIENARYFE